MKPEAQRIAIAEACGWESVSRAVLMGYHRNPKTPAHKSDEREGFWFGVIPDYLNDLNAMHEAENVLSPTQQHIYYEEAIRVVTGYGCMSVHHQNTRKIVSASAAQRAEAFLRAIGKWTDSTPTPP